MENRISQKDENGRIIAEISPRIFVIEYTFVDESLRGVRVLLQS